MIFFLFNFIDFFPMFSLTLCEEKKDWSTEGCNLINLNGSIATCACTHLSVFGVSQIKFSADVQYNKLDDEDMRILNWENIQKYPESILLIICYIFLGMVGAYLSRSLDDVPPIALNRILTE